MRARRRVLRGGPVKAADWKTQVPKEPALNARSPLSQRALFIWWANSEGERVASSASLASDTGVGSQAAETS